MINLFVLCEYAKPHKFTLLYIHFRVKGEIIMDEKEVHLRL